MKNAEELDFARYLRPPRVSASSGFVLAVRLLRCAGDDPPGPVHKSLLRLRDRAESVRFVLAEHQRLRGRSLRPHDQRFDGACAGFHARVHAHTRIDNGASSERAGELLTSLFPDGLKFLTAGYEDEWVQGETLLRRIDDEGLAAELDELAGPPFLDELRKAHAALGEALGVGEEAPPPLPKIGPAVSALAQAIADYGRVRSAFVDLEDPSSVAAFCEAMRPRDELLARGRRSGSEDEAGPEPEEEAPELDELDEPLPELPPLLEQD